MGYFENRECGQFETFYAEKGIITDTMSEDKNLPTIILPVNMTYDQAIKILQRKSKRERGIVRWNATKERIKNFLSKLLDKLGLSSKLQWSDLEE